MITVFVLTAIVTLASPASTTTEPEIMIGLFRDRTTCEIGLGMARARLSDMARVRLECREEAVQ